MKRIIKFNLFLISAFLLISCNTKKAIKEIDVEYIKKIDNLKVLDNTFKDILYIEDGDEQYLEEYKVQIQLSIKMSEIEFDQNTKTLKIPKPEVLSEPILEIIGDKRSSDLFFWTKPISNETVNKERNKHINELKEEILRDDRLMSKSKATAIEQLKNLVDEIYQAYGKKSEIQYVFKE